MRSVATNETVQRATGSAMSQVIGNKEVQEMIGREVGNAATRAANDENAKRRLASGFRSLGNAAKKSVTTENSSE